MYRVFCLALLAALLNACSSVSGKFVAIDDGESFTLPETYTSSGRNTFGYEYVHGLTKGRYIAVGKDDSGTYYRGPSHCIILLAGDLAIRYRQDGRLPNMREKWNQGLGSMYGVEGGIYVPFKPGAKPSYYYYQDASGITGDADTQIPPSPSGPPTEQVSGMIAVRSQDPSSSAAMAYQTAAQATGSPNNVALNAAGAGAGLAVGNVIGTTGLRNMQGNILMGPQVAEPHILENLRLAAPPVAK